MLKNILNIVLATLCLFFKVNGQENKAIDVTAMGIQIGERIPDITISNLYNYRDKKGNLATTAKISDFKGKLLIIDFWATWCSPCVAMIPKMNSLQKQFSGDLQLISVTYQKKEEVIPFLEKFEKRDNKHYNLPIVTDEKELHKLFPHTYLPHYVWIDKDGVVKAITESSEINVDNIYKVKNNIVNKISEKKDVIKNYDPLKPLFNDTPFDSYLLTHSITTKYIEGLGCGFYYNIKNPDSAVKRRITARNLSIPQLYQLALGRGVKNIGWNRTALEVSDTTVLNSNLSGEKYRSWLKVGNGYNYELIIPTGHKNPFYVMEEDLKIAFPKYTAVIENRKMKCLILIKTDNIDLIKTKGGNAEANFELTGFELINQNLESLTTYLDYYIMQKKMIPVINGTGYNHNVDLKIDAMITDITALNSELKKYGLKFIESNRPIEFLVIKDNPKQNK